MMVDRDYLAEAILIERGAPMQIELEHLSALVDARADVEAEAIAAQNSLRALVMLIRATTE